MPVIKLSDAAINEETPDNCNPDLGPYRAHLLSDAGGLTQFGAFLETLPPGSKSSDKHWHEAEDEFVYVIDGKVVVHEGDTSTEMTQGDAATFKAGVDTGHYLENQSDRDASYLVVGTRSGNDVVHYSHKDKIATIKDGVRSLTNRQGMPIDE